MDLHDELQAVANNLGVKAETHHLLLAQYLFPYFRDTMAGDRTTALQRAVHAAVAAPAYWFAT